MPRHHTQQHKHQPSASHSKQSKSQRLDTMARKKDERAARKKERKAASNVVSADDKSFAAQLELMGLKVREVIGDGNCLFRALADQLDGDDHAHARHRQDVVRYITEHRADFEPFIEDDVPFTQHVQNLALDGTYGGNDSIVAFARLHKLTVVIHQLDSPAWEVHGETVDGSSGKSPALVRQLHISYHNGDHYASVRRIQDNTESPANVHICRQAPTSDTDSQTQRTGNSNVGLGRFDHFRFGFGQFFTKNRGLSFPRFGFCTLTATFTSRLQPPGVDITSPDAPRRQPASHLLLCGAE